MIKMMKMKKINKEIMLKMILKMMIMKKINKK